MSRADAQTSLVDAVTTRNHQGWATCSVLSASHGGSPWRLHETPMGVVGQSFAIVQ